MAEPGFRVNKTTQQPGSRTARPPFCQLTRKSPIRNNPGRRPFSNHQSRRVGIPGSNRRHNTGVSYPQSGHAMTAQPGINHRQSVIARPHFASPDRVKNRCPDVTGLTNQFRVGFKPRTWQKFLRSKTGQCVACHDSAGNSNRSRRDLTIMLGRQIIRRISWAPPADRVSSAKLSPVSWAEGDTPTR